MQQGNPTLKPSIEHTVSLMAMYKMLTVGANFSHINDLVCNWSEGIEGTGAGQDAIRRIGSGKR